MNEDDDAGRLIERLATLENLIPNFVEVEVVRRPDGSGFRFGKERGIRYEQELSPRLLTWTEEKVQDTHVVPTPPWRRWQKRKIVKVLVPAGPESPREPEPEPEPDIECEIQNETETKAVECGEVLSKCPREVVERVEQAVSPRQDKHVQTGIALAIDGAEDEWKKEKDVERCSARAALQRCFSVWLERWYRVLFVRVATEARMNQEMCRFDFDDEIEEEEHTETKANLVDGPVYRNRRKAGNRSRLDDAMIDDVLDMVLDDE